MIVHGTLSPDGALSLDDPNDAITGFGDAYPSPVVALRLGQATTTTESASVATSAGQVVTASAPSPFVIDAVFDSSITNLATSSPTLYSEITSAISVAVQFYENEITSPANVTIDFGYGEVGGAKLASGALGESISELAGPLTYSDIQGALAAVATSANDASAVASLGTGDPTKGGNFMLTVAQAIAMGYTFSSDFAGDIGLSSKLSLDYNPNNRGVTGEYDAIGVLEHEISEVLGRISLLGENILSVSNGVTSTIAATYSALDLFRFDAPGTRELVGGQPAYLSVDGGTTDLAAFNTVSGGDYGDWASSVTTDSYDAFSSTGSAYTVSATDRREMDVLGYELTAACFAASTPIRTTRGYVPIEALAVGDMVHARYAGPVPVRWIGRRRIDCRRHPDPHQVWPVRIVAGAFGEGQPNRDVFLSPEHAVQVEDALIPIRLLLNGATIRQEPVPAIEYFHIELEQHDILDVDGLAAESYLDTGNRGLFDNADEPLVLHPQLTMPPAQACRVQGSCLPLLSDPQRAELIWRRLVAEAEWLGFATPESPATDDPALCLVVEGQCLHPVSRDGDRHVFVVPRATGDMRLRSRSAIASGLRPWVDDRRQLGVMVRRIIVRGEAGTWDIAMDDPRLWDGWWAAEGAGTAIWRWTNGDAMLPPVFDGPAMIDVIIGQPMLYPIPTSVTSAPAMARRAA